MSCAKMSEPIEIPFRIAESDGPKEPCIRWECRCSKGKGYFSRSVQPIASHRIPGDWLNGELCKNGWTDLNDL